MRPQNMHETLIDPFSRTTHTHTHSTKNRVHHLTAWICAGELYKNRLFSLFYTFGFFVVDASGCCYWIEKKSLPHFF